MGGAAVLAVSTREELAVQLAPRTVAERRVGTAARVPSSRGGARALATMVFSADWHPDGSDLAVSTYNDQRAAIEFPSGKVLARPDRISLIRFSGDGRFVVYCGAQVDTPVTINVVRAAGGESPRTLATTQGCSGLAWHPALNEIWFSHDEVGGQSSFRALRLDGNSRLVWRGPGRLRLQDIASDGRVLMVSDRDRQIIMLGHSGAAERDVAWLQFSVAADISADGRVLLINERLADGGRGASYYIRSTDGSAAIRVGDGQGLALSPDASQVLALADPLQFQLVGVGGEPITTLPHPDLFSLFAWFSPDGRTIFFNGRPRSGDAGWQFYSMPVGGKQITPVTRAGFDHYAGQQPFSPDGRFISGLAATAPRNIIIDRITGQESPVVGIRPNEVVARFTEDSRGLYVFNRERLPARVFRVDFQSGARTFWKEFTPAEAAGVTGIESIVMTPNARTYAYNYARRLAELYVIAGLK